MTRTQLLANALGATQMELHVAPGVVAYAKVATDDGIGHLRKPLHVLPHHEEGGRHLLASEDLEDRGSGPRIRTIV